MREALEVYVDGSGEERVGRPGGWAFIVLRGDAVIAEGDGAQLKTSALCMELEAALAGLEAARRHRRGDEVVVLISDSSIALDIAAGRFMPKPAQFTELSRALRAAALAVDAETKWVRGHAGHRWNEAVDARAAAAKRAQTQQQ